MRGDNEQGKDRDRGVQEGAQTEGQHKWQGERHQQAVGDKVRRRLRRRVCLGRAGDIDGKAVKGLCLTRVAVPDDCFSTICWKVFDAIIDGLIDPRVAEQYAVLKQGSAEVASALALLADHASLSILYPAYPRQ